MEKNEKTLGILLPLIAFSHFCLNFEFENNSEDAISYGDTTQMIDK